VNVHITFGLISLLTLQAWKKRWFVLRSGRLTGDPDVLEYYTYLGVHLDNELHWECDTEVGDRIDCTSYESLGPSMSAPRSYIYSASLRWRAEFAL